MGSPVKLRFDQGWVTARDRADLRNGELQAATGGTYKPGDPTRLWKIGGRALSADTQAHSQLGGAGKVVGLYLAQYDSGGTDYLYALNAVGGFYRKPPAIDTNGFSTTGLTSAFTSAATAMSGAHYDNVHYLCNGVDLNQAAPSSGTLRQMGMLKPEAAPTTTQQTITADVQRFTAEAANTYGAGVDIWQNTSGATDTSANTFAWVTLGKSDVYTTTSKEQEWRYAPAGYVAASSRVEFTYRLSTGNVNTNPGTKVGSGGNQAGRFNVRVILSVSVNSGGAYTQILNQIFNTSMPDVLVVQFAIPDATYAANAIRVRASAQLISKGDGCSLRVADIRLMKGGRSSNITTTVGFQYAITEFDSTGPPNAQESEPSLASDLVTMTGTTNQVTVTRPTLVNARATDWRVWRTPDGGAYPLQLNLIATVPASQSTWVDAFSPLDYNQAGTVFPEFIVMNGAQGTLLAALYGAPPTCKQFFVHRGRLCGIPATSDRSLAYSEPGIPEGWPWCNSDNDFPLQEGDRLICGRSVGDLMLLFCSTTVISMMDVAAWVDGQFRMTQKSTIRGAPGCVGQDAVAVFTAGGEPMAAWVSYQGIYVTDGHSANRISDEQEWASILATASLGSAELQWDRDRQCLVFAYDSDGGGTNDRFALLHMAPEHAKEGGQPKWSGPHYGSIASMASGMVSGVHRLWSGHVSDGRVYLENNGTTDQSSSYSGTQVPFIVQTARLYGDSLGGSLSWRDWATYKARLRHTAAGGSETVSVLWTTGRDSSGVTQTVTKTPSIVSQQANEFYVGLGGEWAEVQLTHTGSAQWGIVDLTADAMTMGRSGRVA